MTSTSPSAATTPVTSPSGSLVGNLRGELMRYAPFAQMAPEHVDRFVAAARMAYYAPAETMLEPASGPVERLYYVRQGRITGRKGLADLAGEFEYEAGDLFPIAAFTGRRAVSATYRADIDTFCLEVPAVAAQALATDSAPFADFLTRRVLQFLELSQRALQADYASQAVAEQSLEARLDTLPRQRPLACTRDTSLAQALAQMHERRVGSMLVVDAFGTPEGILTRHDILGRVTLPQVPLATPIGQVMSAPIFTLPSDSTFQDAALLMARHGIRHLPVLENGRIVNIVSERDLFALQRLSLKQVSTQLRSAPDVPALIALSAQIRRLARNLLGQGVQARQLTELISHLNDLLTERLVQLVAAARGMDLSRACWLAFGSEGRSEQTISTDQDNGLVFESDAPEADRPAWLAFAHEINLALDACGYPLCKGNVMASNTDCCLTPTEWQSRFSHWIDHGAPEDLLKASIYFDLRPIAGRSELAAPLRAMVLAGAQKVPRFLKQLADNSLRSRAPLSWRGAVETQSTDGHEWFDLKLHGTAIFVDAARLFALAHGVDTLATRARLTSAAPALGAEPNEADTWVSAFEFLQMLRLRAQLAAGEPPSGSAEARIRVGDFAAGRPRPPEPDQRRGPECDRPPDAQGSTAGCAHPSAAHRTRLSGLMSIMFSALKRLLGANRLAVDDGRWIVLDVESSGLDARRDRLIAIAAIAVRVDGSDAQIALGDSFEVVLRQPEGEAHDKDGGRPDKANIMLHGIGVGAQRDGVEPAQALSTFTDYVGHSPLIAFHAAFDQTLIDRSFDATFGHRMPNPWMDLEPLAGVLHPKVKARSLDEWLARFDIHCMVRHQAASDTLATAELLLKLWPALLRQCPQPTFSQALALAASRRWLPS